MTTATDDAPGLDPEAILRVDAPTAWHRLNPLTRLIVAVGTMVAALLVGGVVCPTMLAVAVVLLPAATARVLAPVLRLTLLLALPLALSAALVNVLFTPSGATVAAEIGPLIITGEGVELAAEVVARVVLMAGAVALFYLTLRPSELTADLGRRGVPARITFVIHNAVAMLPRLAERARQVTEAQRARGLDTEGNLFRRARGLVAVTAPTVMGAIAEVETRTLALESRGFTRPGARTILWAPPDRGWERALRWAVVVALVLLVILRLAGVPLPC
jgi:energy-coupling factor transport system permease protein